MEDTVKLIPKALKALALIELCLDDYFISDDVTSKVECCHKIDEALTTLDGIYLKLVFQVSDIQKN